MDELKQRIKETIGRLEDIYEHIDMYMYTDECECELKDWDEEWDKEIADLGYLFLKSSSMTSFENCNALGLIYSNAQKMDYEMLILALKLFLPILG